MTAPSNPLDLDEAVRLYLSGKPIKEIETLVPVSGARLYGELRTRGIPPSRKFASFPRDQVVAAYRQGASVLGLSKEYGVSRPTIAKCLIEAGVEMRSHSEAQHLRQASLSLNEKKLLTAAANRAARLRRAPEIEKLRRALRVEAEGKHDSVGESSLAEMLQSRGVLSVPQRAIGPYNVDLAINPVAVEVLGGGWHSIKPIHSERTPYILDEGWHLLMVWDYEGRSALGPGAAEYIVSFVEEVRRNPPATCQYRVISGHGEMLSASGREDNEFPLVPPPRGSVR